MQFWLTNWEILYQIEYIFIRLLDSEQEFLKLKLLQTLALIIFSGINKDKG